MVVLLTQMRLYWTFIRPFTLLVPATGMIAGALMALGADPKWQSDWTGDAWGIALRIAAGALLAASLNAYSNSVNQIYDVEVDRINKPQRLLPSGKISIREAWGVALFFLLLAILLSYGVSRQCFVIVLSAAFLTYIYSAPPLRTKSRGVLANLTIALPRGTLLVVAGWATVKSVLQAEPWYIGAIFGAYFLGAVTTKDFSDIEGDRIGGCRTLPVIYGVRKAVWMIAPFFVLPFLAVLPGAIWQLFTGNRGALVVLGILLPVWGAYIVYLLIRDPEQLHHTENHPSWRHMYLLTLVAQFGFAIAYLTR